MRLAVFDCDGTLVDSQANICRAMEAAFAASGLPPPPRAETRRIVGLSLVEAARALLPHADDAAHRRLAADYRAAFQRMRAAGDLDEEPLFDGIAALIEHLGDDGWTLGVATGKSDRGLAHVVAAHGWQGRFATLQTADRHPSKPDPSMLLAAMAAAGVAPPSTAMIGDTSFDMAMAKAAGAVAIGVAWGYHPAADLTAAGADAVADTVEDVLPLLYALVSP